MDKGIGGAMPKKEPYTNRHMSGINWQNNKDENLRGLRNINRENTLCCENYLI
jgi:hypothetical protein